MRDDMCQHELQLLRSKEPPGTSVATMSKAEEGVLRVDEALVFQWWRLFLLGDFGFGFGAESFLLELLLARRREAEGVVFVGCRVEGGIAMDGGGGSRYVHAGWDMNAVWEVDTILGNHLCIPGQIESHSVGEQDRPFC